MLVMEASQVIGDFAEECSSCESGWTMYLSSPAHHHHDGVDDHSEVESAAVSCISSKVMHGGDEDDDSMASDASTGGIQRNLSYDQFDVFDDDDEEEGNNDAYDGFEEVKCCTQYPAHSLPKTLCMVQETWGEDSTVMVPTSEAEDIIDSKVRHDIVAGDQC